MPRLVIVSNRLPITIKEEEGELIYHPSAGGLATGLNSLDKSINKLWIGWPGKSVTDDWEKESIRRDLQRRDLFPVFLEAEEVDLYYRGFSNKTVWPHFHYFTQFTTYSEEYWEAYRKVNRKFADAVIQQLRDDDMVWVHDYQLMLVPAMIREAFPQISIGFFLHIPFPSYEIFRILPWRKQILEGILGADQIGFHTFGYMRHFLSAVYRIIGYEHEFGTLTVENRIINVDAFPMGIDYDKYAHPNPDLSKEGVQKIKALAQKTKLVISIDRLDYTKGITQRIKAFGQFIERHPEYQGEATLMMVVVPSRATVDQYQELKHQVDELVGEINGLYGTYDWTPIQYFYRSLDFDELTTLYQFADVALLTPLRDGMNLVAKEYVAAKEETKRGVLILSEMAGAANELTDALIINPQDVNDMVEAIVTALQMDEQEQKQRLENMQFKLRKYTVRNWANTFMNEQQKLMREQKQHHIYRLEGAERSKLHEAYRQAGKRLIIMDYDGTLMPFHPDPQAVVPDQQLISILTDLQKIEGNQVVVNSGRDRDTLRRWLGESGIDLAAEHGVWIKFGDEWVSNPNLANGWKEQVHSLLEDLVERTPGTFIEEKDYSLAWHYRRIDKDLGQKRVREFRDVLRYLTTGLDLQVLEGNKVVEIKNAGVNKGHATLNWLNQRDWDFIMALGDDHTDEDIFKVLPESAFTIKVGLATSVARYNLLSVEEVRELLGSLT